MSDKYPPRIILAVVMVAMIAGSVALYLQAVADPPITASDWVSFVWCPLGLGFLWFMAEYGARARARKTSELTVLPGHTRFRRIALSLFMLLAVVAHGMIIAKAYGIIGPDTREMAARLLIVGIGVVYVILGDRRAKLATPYRGGVTEPFNWQRHQRTVGWIMVIGGLLVIPCALLLPFEAAAYGTLGAMVAAAIIGIAVRLSMRRARS